MSNDPEEKKEGLTVDSAGGGQDPDAPDATKKDLPISESFSDGTLPSVPTPPDLPPDIVFAKTRPLLGEYDDLVVDGQPFKEYVAVLDNFFRNNGLTHYWAKFELMRRYSVLTGLPGGEVLAALLNSQSVPKKPEEPEEQSPDISDESTDLGRDFDVIQEVRGRIQVSGPLADRFDIKKVLRNIPREALFSSRAPSEHEEADDAKRRLWETVNERWKAICRDPSSRYFFTEILGFGNGTFGPDTALKCPRVLKTADLPVLGVDPQTQEEYLAEILRFRTLFLLITRKSFDSGSSDDQKSIPYYRVGYLFAQIAALLSEKLGKILEGTPHDIKANLPNVENEPYSTKTSATQNMFGHGGPNRPLDEFYVHAPSLLLFPPGTDPSIIDSYIKCNLSLIFPDNGREDRESFGTEPSACCVQEDFITMDLMILADRFGLFENPKYKKDYRELFNALGLYRKMQYVKHYHSDAEASRDPDKTRVPLLNFVQRLFEKRQGKPITVSSLGHGDGVLERLMMESGSIGILTAVDIDPNARFDQTDVRQKYNGNYRETIVGVSDKLERNSATGSMDSVTGTGSIYRESPDVRRRVMDSLQEADVVVAADVLHETSDPYAYIRGLWDKVAPGGYLYIVDPIHCEAVDEVTKMSVNNYDRTKWAASMLPLEDHFNMIGGLKMMGAIIKNISVVPGTYAGYNDSYSRVTIVLKKPAILPRKPGEYRGVDYDMPYERSLEDWDKELQRVEDIFEVWPLSTITSATQRQRLLETLNNNVRNCTVGDLKAPGFGIDPATGRFSMKYKDVKKEVIKWLIPVHEVYGYIVQHGWHREPRRGQCKAYERYVVAAMPYPLEKIRRSFGEIPPEILSKNHLAGEVRALESLLRNASYNCGLPTGSLQEDAEITTEPLAVIADLGDGWGSSR